MIHTTDTGYMIQTEIAVHPYNIAIEIEFLEGMKVYEALQLMIPCHLMVYCGKGCEHKLFDLEVISACQVMY